MNNSLMYWYKFIRNSQFWYKFTGGQNVTGWPASHSGRGAFFLASSFKNSAFLLHWPVAIDLAHLTCLNSYIYVYHRILISYNLIFLKPADNSNQNLFPSSQSNTAFFSPTMQCFEPNYHFPWRFKKSGFHCMYTHNFKSSRPGWSY